MASNSGLMVGLVQRRLSHPPFQRRGPQSLGTRSRPPPTGAEFFSFPRLQLRWVSTSTPGVVVTGVAAASPVASSVLPREEKGPAGCPSRCSSDAEECCLHPATAPPPQSFSRAPSRSAEKNPLGVSSLLMSPALPAHGHSAFCGSAT